MVGVTKAVDVLAGDSGQRRITRTDVVWADWGVLGHFQQTLESEALRRGLDLLVERELPSDDIVVTWRPSDMPLIHPV